MDVIEMNLVLVVNITDNNPPMNQAGGRSPLFRSLGCCVLLRVRGTVLVLSCGVCYEAQIVDSSGHLCNYRYSTELLWAKVVFNVCCSLKK